MYKVEFDRNSKQDPNHGDFVLSWKDALKSAEYFERIQFRMAAKGGVAATLSLFFGVGLSQALNRPDSLVSGLFTVITSIVVLQAYLGGTYQAAWVRFLGTFIGTIIGCFFTLLLGSNAVALGISVFCTIAICSLLSLNESLRIASMSVSVVIISWGINPTVSPWTFGLFRFMDACMGIAIAVIVAHTLWPTQATRKVRLTIVDALKKMRHLYLIALSFETKGHANKRDAEKLMRESVELMRQTRGYLQESRVEIRTKSSLSDWLFLIEHLEKTFELISHLKEIDKSQIKKIFTERLTRSTHSLILCIDLALEELAETLEERAQKKKPINVLGSLETLQEELINYREMQIAKKILIDDAENFFVYFHNLKALAEEVMKIDEKIHNLYK